MVSSNAKYVLMCRALLLSVLVFSFDPFSTAPTAQAAPVCTTSGNQVTCVFRYTGASETWTVPARVTEVTFDLSGAQGGNGPRRAGWVLRRRRRWR